MEQIDFIISLQVKYLKWIKYYFAGKIPGCKVFFIATPASRQGFFYFVSSFFPESGCINSGNLFL
ncbi:MAG: hypothetical protein A2X13_06235 [Bacteroidetes bacterium GWC2_33_15]|nr:MAG: hypothetical protein A2X10_03525 [Bacteroidetes bacterium GWA2_33_15]OFX51822.1 MAG: hypothetical protein A2X13_06235 [Bacteroidetes bacterium GWC2_33_15]OFX66806.1 MAG: hypothetical protein A2X15_08890 [Bacteroidetes bacterium GWB2_32_14]OFX67064.1 MAG: hypothetical protein A2X14_10395 [Bacteroidetes bacterium GWD2_33_33]HAN17154.1 hypothetical protein [Bacteroidales bacterium]